MEYTVANRRILSESIHGHFIHDHRFLQETKARMIQELAMQLYNEGLVKTEVVSKHERQTDGTFTLYKEIRISITIKKEDENE